MRPPNRKPPRRLLGEREGQSKLTAPKVNPPFPGSKSFDAVEKKLSLALDAFLDAIETYREGKR